MKLEELKTEEPKIGELIVGLGGGINVYVRRCPECAGIDEHYFAAVTYMPRPEAEIVSLMEFDVPRGTHPLDYAKWIIDNKIMSVSLATNEVH